MIIGLFLPAPDFDAADFDAADVPFPFWAWSISKKSLSDFTSTVLNLAAAPLSIRFRRSSAGLANAPRATVHIVLQVLFS